MGMTGKPPTPAPNIMLRASWGPALSGANAATLHVKAAQTSTPPVSMTPWIVERHPS